MAMPADLISQGGPIEMNVEIEWLKAQKVFDNHTLQAQRQRVEKLDGELRKSRDTIHRRTRKNRKLLRKNIALGRKLEGKDEEAFRLKRYVRRELTKVNYEAIEKVREAARLAEYHSKDASAKEDQIGELQDKLQKITKEKDAFKPQASNARMELTIAKSRFDEELEKRQLTVATLVGSCSIDEINRLQAQNILQSQEIEQLKCFLQISLEAVAVLNGTESPQVILQQIQLAVQIALENYVQNDQKLSQLREDLLQRKIIELKELVINAESTITDAKDHAFDMIKSKNDSERKLVAEERKSNELWGRIQTLEDQHKAAIRKLKEQHVIAKERLKSQYSTELMERTDKIVDWLAQDAEANMDFFQRQFELVREENARLQLKTSRSKFVELQRENEQLQWDLKIAKALASRAKEKVEVAPQASEQIQAQTAATSSTDADAPQAEEASCPIEGDSKDQESTAAENIHQENSEEEISEASTLVRENSEMGESTDSPRADASGSASSNEESITAENNSNEESGDMYESSTLVVENSKIVDSIDSHPSGQNEATLPTHDAIETQAAPEILAEADTEIQANLNVIANTDSDHAAKKEEAGFVQSNFEEVQKHDGHVVSRRGRAEIHDEDDKDDEDDFNPRLWKFLSWLTLLAVFLHRLQTLGLLKIPINEAHIESPEFSSLRSILVVDSETQNASSNGVVSSGLNPTSNLCLSTITLATPVSDAPKCEGWMEEYIQSVIMLPEPTSSPHDTPAPEPVFEQPAPVSTWSSITGFFNNPYKVAGWGLGAGSAWVGWQQRGVISTWWC